MDTRVAPTTGMMQSSIWVGLGVGVGVGVGVGLGIGVGVGVEVPDGLARGLEALHDILLEEDLGLGVRGQGQRWE